ncbi:hypothetical protein AAG906_018992 [Vitis piasezkii]
MWDCPELMTSLPQEMPSLKTLQMLEIKDYGLHFDHVLHHPSSAAIKEHVPKNRLCMVARQRGMMEATVIKI